MNQKPLAFTCGDPAGVGPEIIASWLRDHAAELADPASVRVIGPACWLETLPLTAVQRVPVGRADFVATPGQPCGDGALVAWRAMERAAAGCAAGEFSGVVTGPVSKERLARIGYAFPGQTEFFAARWGGAPTMAFAGGKLRVVLLTWHIPLRDVPAQLTTENFTRAIAAADELARIELAAAAMSAAHAAGAAASSLAPALPGTAGPGASTAAAPRAPRIAVCGLNPHAGEAGLLGAEERDVIDPILDGLRVSYPGLSRCVPGDTAFARQLRDEFDVVIALYHDQGLAPLKVIDFDDAVNITLGLPHVRTSPDHGTAYGIAGQGIARGTSFAQAVALARRLIAARQG